MAHGTNGEDISDFDPTLSPHSYPNGIDGGAVSNEAEEDGYSTVTSSTFGFQSIKYQDGASSRVQTYTVETSTTFTSNEEFDPLLSPHAYPNGIDAGAVIEEGEKDGAQIEKLGILLIGEIYCMCALFIDFY